MLIFDIISNIQYPSTSTWLSQIFRPKTQGKTRKDSTVGAPARALFANIFERGGAVGCEIRNQRQFYLEELSIHSGCTLRF